MYRNTSTAATVPTMPNSVPTPLRRLKPTRSKLWANQLAHRAAEQPLRVVRRRSAVARAKAMPVQPRLQNPKSRNLPKCAPRHRVRAEVATANSVCAASVIKHTPPFLYSIHAPFKLCMRLVPLSVHKRIHSFYFTTICTNKSEQHLN